MGESCIKSRQGRLHLALFIPSGKACGLVFVCECLQWHWRPSCILHDHLLLRPINKSVAITERYPHLSSRSVYLFSRVISLISSCLPLNQGRWLSLSFQWPDSVDFIFILSDLHNLSTESQNHAGIHSQRNLWPWQSETLFFFSFFLFSVFFSHEGCNITTWPLQVYWKSQEGYTWINTNCVYMCMFVCVCVGERGERVCVNCTSTYTPVKGSCPLWYSYVCVSVCVWIPIHTAWRSVAVHMHTVCTKSTS